MPAIRSARFILHRAQALEYLCKMNLALQCFTGYPRLNLMAVTLRAGTINPY